jgi:poly-beta-1,6-N-acetyl-D-glucosamine synthase
MTGFIGRSISASVLSSKQNTRNMSALSYVVVSPAKDEAERIEKTIQSMLRQTVRPARWVIVDDGSSDNTSEIVKSHTQSTDWISLIRVNRDAMRRIGSAEIRAFETGLHSLAGQQFDLAVKLDCDLILEPNYFESLIAHFEADPQLGIASGVYLERKGDAWTEVAMPSYHASGASKMIRAKCLSDIGGFPLLPGWDTADEIKAQTKGWKTRHFADLKFYHLRPEGSAIGGWKTGILHGHIYYVTGGGLFFLLFKSAHRLITGRPIVLGGVAMLWGYLKARLEGSPRLVTDMEAEFYRRLLNSRLFRVFHPFQLARNLDRQARSA